MAAVNTLMNGPVIRGSRHRATYRASVQGILGSLKRPVYSMGSRFYNDDEWTSRVLVTHMCKWAKGNPGCVPTRDDVTKWVIDANAHKVPNPKIVIASTPERLPLRLALALTGGVYHEAFHTKYSCRRHLSVNEICGIVLPRWAKLADWSKFYKAIQEWSNVIEDIRIERRGREEFPGTEVKLHDLQDLIFTQEASSRLKAEAKGLRSYSSLGVILCTFRDVGLGYVTPLSKLAFAKYRENDPKAVDFVLDGPLSDILRETIALPVTDDLGNLRLAMDVLIKLQEAGQEEEAPPPPSNGPCECPQCGAKGRKLVVRPMADGLGGKVPNKGVMTCTVCGWQTEVDLQDPSDAPEDEEPADPSEGPRFEGFDPPENPPKGKPGKGKGEDQKDKKDKAEPKDKDDAAEEDATGGSSKDSESDSGKDDKGKDDKGDSKGKDDKGDSKDGETEEDPKGSSGAGGKDEEDLEEGSDPEDATGSSGSDPEDSDTDSDAGDAGSETGAEPAEGDDPAEDAGADKGIDKTDDSDEEGKGSGTPDKGDDAEGDDAEGDETEGDETEGDETEGDETEGDETEGDETEGDETEGDETEGDDAEGDETEGDETDGDKADNEDIDAEDGKGAGDTNKVPAGDGEETDPESDATEADSHQGGDGPSEALNCAGNDWSDIADSALDSIESDDPSGLIDSAAALETGVAKEEAAENADVRDDERAWRPYDLDKDIIRIVPESDLGRSHDATQASLLLKSVKEQVSFLMGRLRNIVKASEMIDVTHGVRQGKRLSERFLVDSRISLMDGRLPNRAYVERSEEQDVSIAACLVLDESESMKGILLEVTKVLMALTAPLDAIGCKTQVAGFRNADRWGLAGERPTMEAAAPYHRFGGIIHDVFKTFDEKFTPIQWRFANTVAWGGTPMSDGIQFALDSISPRQEGHRFVFIITDGEPDPLHQPIVRRQIRLAREAGIHLVGVGIGKSAESVKTLFPDHVHTDTIQDMPRALVEKLNHLIADPRMASLRGRQVAK